MAKQQQQDEPEISEEDRKRIQKATTLLAAYVNFMRWAGNFRRDEITKHGRHQGIVLLSPLQSSRFAFAVEDSTLLLGAQPFEFAWLTVMPFDAAYVSDRLYLTASGVECLDVKLPAITIGFFCDQKAKRDQMAACSYVVPVPIEVADGVVTDVGRPVGLGVPIKPGDVVSALKEQALAQQNRRDLARYF